MKYFLLFSACIAWLQVASAQCTVDISATDFFTTPEGTDLSGDSVFLPDYGNSAYSATFQVNVPEQYTYQGQNATVNFVRIDDVLNLPDGLSYQCNDASCQIASGNQGCLEIFGTANSAIADGALDQIQLEIVANISLGTITVDLTTEQIGETLGIDNVFIRKNALLSTNEFNALSVVELYPNPAESVLHIAVADLEGQEAAVTLVDLFGREISSHVIPEGENTVDISVEGLVEGVYFATILSSDGKSSTMKWSKQ